MTDESRQLNRWLRQLRVHEANGAASGSMLSSYALVVRGRMVR